MGAKNSLRCTHIIRGEGGGPVVDVLHCDTEDLYLRGEGEGSPLVVGMDVELQPSHIQRAQYIYKVQSVVAMDSITPCLLCSNLPSI